MDADSLLAPKGVIVIDGSNGTGKSTLANAFKQRWPEHVKVYHCKHRFARHMWLFHACRLHQAIRHADHGGLAIVDRNWLSEDVYGHVYRGGTTIPMQGRIVQKLLLKHAVLSIVCLASESTVRRQIAAHRTDYHSPQFLAKSDQVTKRYLDLWHGNIDPDSADRSGTYAESIPGGLKTLPNYHSYEFETDGRNLDRYVNLTVARLAEALRAQPTTWARDCTRNIAGSFEHARLALVGDCVNHADYRKCWPFFEHRRSSLLITRVIDDLRIPEHHLLWTNANCPEDHLDEIARGARVGRWRVVALGGKASDALRARGIQHASTRHPSYALRFGAAHVIAEDIHRAYSQG